MPVHWAGPLLLLGTPRLPGEEAWASLPDAERPHVEGAQLLQARPRTLTTDHRGQPSGPRPAESWTKENC